MSNLTKDEKDKTLTNQELVGKQVNLLEELLTTTLTTALRIIGQIQTLQSQMSPEVPTKNIQSLLAEKIQTIKKADTLDTVAIKLVNTFFSSSIVENGVGKLEITPELPHYENDLSKVDHATIVKYPDGFYTNHKTHSLQFLFRSEEGGNQCSIIIDNIDTEPTFYLLHDSNKLGDLELVKFNHSQLKENEVTLIGHLDYLVKRLYS